MKYESIYDILNDTLLVERQCSIYIRYIDFMNMLYY